MSKKYVEIAKNLIEEILPSFNCELFDVEYKKEGSSYVLRYYIEKLEDKINLDDLSEITRVISKKLDEKEFIETEYMLEVSSPGINRVLKTKEHFKRYIDSQIDISLYRPVNKKKKLTGVLKGYNEDSISIFIDEEMIDIKLEEISKINLHFDF